VTQDNAAVYELLASEVHAKTPFAEFDQRMKKLQAEWLKPVRVYSVSRPELLVLVTCELKPTPQRRERLEEIRDKKLGDTVPWRYDPTLRMHEGEWYIWRR